MKDKVMFMKSSMSEGLGASSMRFIDEVESIHICRDDREGKNLITVKINGDLVFSYDTNFKGEVVIFNGIQMPIEEFRKRKR